MKLDIRELNEGSNPIAFDIDVAGFDAILKEVDELYVANAPCEVRFDVQKLEDMLMVVGEVRAPHGAQCARCLADLARSLTLKIRWTLLPTSSLGHRVSEEEEVELTTDDLDVSFYEGDEIDLADLVREAVLLETEPIPRCDVDDCPNKLYQQPPAESAPKIDPRWGPLQQMKEKLSKN